MNIRGILENSGIDEEFLINGKLKRERNFEELPFPWKIIANYSDEDGKEYTICKNTNSGKRMLLISHFSGCVELDI